MLIQKMQQALVAKLPQIEADKWMKAVDAIARIRVAEITASKDRDNAQANLDASLLEHVTDMAHEVAMQATDQQHAAAMQAAEPQPAQPAQPQQPQEQQGT